MIKFKNQRGNNVVAANLNSFVNRLMIRSTPHGGRDTEIANDNFRRTRSARVHAMLNFAGSIVVVVGTFFRYTLGVITNTVLSETVTRTAWQMGSDRSIAFSAAPLIVIFAASVFIHEYRFTFGRRRQAVGQLLFTMSTSVAILAVSVLVSWPGKWPTDAGVSYERGWGGWLSLCGVALCVLATLLHYVDCSKVKRSLS
jgi:hypothetical protein